MWNSIYFSSAFKITNRKYPKLKEVDDVLGGAAAWENVDSTAGMACTNKIISKIKHYDGTVGWSVLK